MEVSRKRRVLGLLFNVITLYGLLVGNLFLLLTSGRTIGGMVAGYKYEFGGPRILWLLLMDFLAGLLYVITFSIFFWVDVITMGNRNGTFAEKWASNHKISHR